jgi:hypothetical protein
VSSAVKMLQMVELCFPAGQVDGKATPCISLINGPSGLSLRSAGSPKPMGARGSSSHGYVILSTLLHHTSCAPNKLLHRHSIQFRLIFMNMQYMRDHHECQQNPRSRRAGVTTDMKTGVPSAQWLSCGHLPNSWSVGLCLSFFLPTLPSQFHHFNPCNR